MALPAQKSVPGGSVDSLYWIFFGPPGIGKTVTAASFPDPIFLTTERAHRHVAIFDRQIQSWEDFKLASAELKTAGGAKHKTIIIDTVDLLFKLCLDYVCVKQGFDHPSDEAFGKGYDAVNTEFQREILKLTLLGKGIIFVSHAKEKDITARNIKFSKTVPTMSGGCWKILLPLVDVEAYIGFSTIDVSKRCMIFEPREHLEAKDRFGRFPKELLLPKTGQYEAIKTAWEKPVVAAPPSAGAVRKVVK